MLSLVIPLYRSEANLPRLFRELISLAAKTSVPLEVVFVNDGSPDRCADIVARSAPQLPFPCQLVELSRNFGSFSAIVAGLRQGRGAYFAVLAADLQEPPDLVLDLLRLMVSDEADIVFGVRSARADPLLSTIASSLFWRFYRAAVNKDIPIGGVDIFGCKRQVRDELLAMREVDSSLLALLFWVGFRRAYVSYERQPRIEGNSAWTFRKKLRYALNSTFNFTDLPVRVLLTIGGLGMFVAAVFGIVVLASKLIGNIPVPGYTALVLTIVFFGGLTTLGLGIIGQYLWLTLQNVRQRPLFVTRSVREYNIQRPTEGNTPTVSQEADSTLNSKPVVRHTVPPNA